MVNGSRVKNKVRGCSHIQTKISILGTGKMVKNKGRVLMCSMRLG